MFHTFFPQPTKLFFTSFLVWCAITMGLWYGLSLQVFNIDWSVAGLNVAGGFIGLPPQEGAGQLATIGFFFTNDMIWFYLYYFVSVILFSLFWFKYSPHKWQYWSVLVSGFILFTTAFSVQTSVALNNWRRPFFDMIQDALTGDTKGTVTQAQLYGGIVDFLEIVFFYIAILVVTRFVVSHYIFRWRTAMNDYYTHNWSKLRHIEGASQRVQEDTKDFARTVEVLGVSAIDSVLTLIAFLPILYGLGQSVSELPFIGAIPMPLVTAAIFWSLFGTALMAFAGIKLPGLYFNNQKVEAAFRKELVYGEDDKERSQPPTLKDLYSAVRKNYFRLYFHYMYFNVARYFYLQADNLFGIILLLPTIAAGTITFGFFQQVLSAFGQVSSSFQYLVNAWTTIVELLSIRKRLKAFESQMLGEPLPPEDEQYLRENPAE